MREEETMGFDSAAPVEKGSREGLLDLRDVLRNLLHLEWKSIGDVQMVIIDYVLFLRTVNPSECYINESEQLVDLDLLKELQARLDHEYDKAKDEYFSSHFSYVYAYRRWAMMLKNLSDVLENKQESKISVDFQKWIEQQLLDKDWEGILEYTHLKEGLLKREAEEKGKNVQFLIQTVNSEQIEVNNPEIVESRFTTYQNELADASRKYEENIYARVDIPERCLSVERLVSFLKASCLCKPDDDNSMVNVESEDDDAMVDEEVQDHHSMQIDDGAKLLEKSRDHHLIQPDDGANVYVESQDHCSLQTDDGANLLEKSRDNRLIQPDDGANVYVESKDHRSLQTDDDAMLLNRSQGAVQQSIKRNVNPSERYINKSEERVNLDLLKELQAKLDHEYDKAKDEYFRSQFSYVYAYRRWAMMLKDLSDVLENEKKSKISVDFQEWIKRKLLDEDWVGILEYTHLKEGQLYREAEKDGKDVHLLIQTINSEQIDVNNPETVKHRFMAYQKELDDATRKDEENLCARVHIPERCLSVERLVSFLDNSMVSVESEDHCPPITDDDAMPPWLLEKSQDAVQHPRRQVVRKKRQYPQDVRKSLRVKKAPQGSW